jgi:hypothetical protein
MALEPIQPPIQWVLGVLSPEVKWPGMNLTTHLHLVQRSRMCKGVPPLHQYVFMALCVLKHRDNFIFTFTFVKYMRCGYKVPGMILLQSCVYTSSLLRGVTFKLHPLSSHALSQIMLPLLKTFLELLLWNSFQWTNTIFLSSIS